MQTAEGGHIVDLGIVQMVFYVGLCGGGGVCRGPGGWIRGPQGTSGGHFVLLTVLMFAFFSSVWTKERTHSQCLVRSLFCH